MNRNLIALLVVLACLGGFLGAPGRALAQEGVQVGEWKCTFCHQAMAGPGASGCPQAAGHGGSPPPTPGGDGEMSPFALEILSCGVLGGIGLVMGLGFGFMWLVERLSDETEKDVFEYLDVESMRSKGFLLLPMGMAMGGAIMFIFYFPTLGVSALASVTIDDAGEASSRVATRAEELRVEASAAHDAFVSAHPPSSDTAVDATFFRAADDATTARARRDEAIAATNDLTDPVAAAPAAPAWPVNASMLADPTTRTVRPLAVDVPPAFHTPTPPDTLATRSRDVLDRARGLLSDGAEEARERLVDDLKDRAMGLLPNPVERALKSHLAAEEGTFATLGRVAKEGVRILAFGSAGETDRFEREVAGEVRVTADHVVDEALGGESNQGIVGWLLGGYRAQKDPE